jgi:hypothetical protein
VSENAESDHGTTYRHQANTRSVESGRRGCAEARGGIDIYMGVSLCVVL